MNATSPTAIVPLCDRISASAIERDIQRVDPSFRNETLSAMRRIAMAHRPNLAKILAMTPTNPLGLCQRQRNPRCPQLTPRHCRQLPLLPSTTRIAKSHPRPPPPSPLDLSTNQSPKSRVSTLLSRTSTGEIIPTTTPRTLVHRPRLTPLPTCRNQRMRLPGVADQQTRRLGLGRQFPIRNTHWQPSRELARCIQFRLGSVEPPWPNPRHMMLGPVCRCQLADTRTLAWRHPHRRRLIARTGCRGWILRPR